MQKRFSIYLIGLCILLGPKNLFPKEPLEIHFENVSVLAKENNPTLKNLHSKRRIIKKLTKEKWRDYLPSVGIGFYRQKYIISGSSDSISNEIRLNFEETIFDGGMRKLNLESAKLDDILFSEEAKIESNKIEFESKKHFLTALAVKIKSDLLKQILFKWEEELKIARTEVKEGFSTENQLLSVLSKVQETKLQILNSENTYKKAIIDLKLSLGLKPEDVISLNGNLIKDFLFRKPSIDLKTLIETAISERPEWIRANILRLKTEKEKEYTENLWIPRFSIGGYLGRTDEDFPLRKPTWGMNVKLSFPFGNSTNNSSANTGVRPNSLAGTGIRNDNSNFNSSGQSNLQIFDNLSYSRKLMESKLKASDAKTESRLIEESIQIRILKSTDDIQAKWDAIHFQIGKYSLKYLNRELVKKRFQLGELKNVDLINSENELTESEYGLANSIAEYGISFLEFQSFLPDHSEIPQYFEFKPKTQDLIGYIQKAYSQNTNYSNLNLNELISNSNPFEEILVPSKIFEKTIQEDEK